MGPGKGDMEAFGASTSEGVSTKSALGFFGAPVALTPPQRYRHSGGRGLALGRGAAVAHRCSPLQSGAGTRRRWGCSLRPLHQQVWVTPGLPRHALSPRRQGWEWGRGRSRLQALETMGV